MSLDPDAAARAELARHRGFATGLLLLMAALTVGSLFLPRGYWADLLQAAARAGVVGGIADWFAITALFRHPLGLPIPHTAIIPNQKARLGAALGRFVANHVFTEAEVAATLGKLDLPSLVRGLLESPETARPAAAAVARWLPRLLASVEDGRARRLLARLVPRLLGGAGTGVMMARALRSLVAGGRHQEVFGFVLDQLRAGLAAQEESLRHTIEDRVREQGGRLVGWALGATVAKRVLSSVNAEFEKMEPDNSELRQAFDEWVRREIDRIEQDPERAAEIGRAIGGVVAHDSVQSWFWDVWGRLRAALERDAADPDGRGVALVQGALGDLGRSLSDDPAMRGRLERAVGGVVLHALPALRLELSEFIARVVAGWDTVTIVERLELRIGRDLQFVRINGTLVGFLVGGVLFALLRAGFPRLGF
jgi:uncharacterized membrane-anchored protein YjiN (DUF445 family)